MMAIRPVKKIAAGRRPPRKSPQVAPVILRSSAAKRSPGVIHARVVAARLGVRSELLA